VSGTVLAVDYGEARLGVAISDPTRTFVFGRENVERKSDESAFSALTKICREDMVRLVVVGLPINADGTEGGAARLARAFGAAIAARTGLPVVFADERYTTIEADEVLREQHRDWRERKKRVDRAAATLILKTFLDHGPYRG
jgi:putative holliday junction resolvase